MQLVLPPEVESFVQEQLDRGKYRSPVEVVLAAMQLLQEQEQEEEKWVELRQKVQEGLEDSKNGRVIDGATAMARIKDNLRKRREASGS